MNNVDNIKPAYLSSTIFENANFALKYSGPDPSKVARAVVSFPDLIYPAGFEASGWGNAFFIKRGQPIICVLFKKANWYQSEGFFEAMRAARAFLGANVKISAYGASMGGYGAILAGKALKADHVLALCPQYTVQQDVAPFERRFRDQAREIGTFLYDIDAELDDAINYVVVYDPTHSIDRRHIALFKNPKKWTCIPLPGSGHGVLMNVFEMVSKDVVLDLIMNQIAPHVFRRRIRMGRVNSIRYIRRMGNLTLHRHHEFTKIFIDYARKNSNLKLVERWQETLRNSEEVRPTIIIHPGLPKTGTSAIQLYFKSTHKAYQRRQIIYPTDNVNPRVFSHSWLSHSLRNGNVTELSKHLKQTPLNVKKLIFSDESLYVEAPLFSPETREKLKALLAPYAVRIVVTQSSLSQWKKSFYLQALKNRRSASQGGASRLWGTSLSYRQFFEDNLVQRLTDRNACIADIADLFGAQSTDIVTKRPGQDIVPDFCNAAGLRYFDKTPTAFTNLSMTDLNGEIQRQANGFTVNQAGFVRKLLDIEIGVDVNRIRANRLRKLTLLGADLPWGDFAYKTNSPLKYTKSAFTNRIAELKDLANRISRSAASS